MFYQDNNDYMRDSCFYGNGMMGNIQPPYFQNQFQMNPIPLENMYPQIYKIINPVVNRVISNSNSQFITEEILNNMTDTVYNIVEGDISNLVSITNNSNITDEVNKSSAPQNTNNRGMNNPTDRRDTSNSIETQSGNNRILRDLIKIMIIKNLLARRNNLSYPQNQLPMSYYNPYGYGMF